MHSDNKKTRVYWACPTLWQWDACGWIPTVRTSFSKNPSRQTYTEKPELVNENGSLWTVYISLWTCQLEKPQVPVTWKAIDKTWCMDTTARTYPTNHGTCFMIHTRYFLRASTCSASNATIGLMSIVRWVIAPSMTVLCCIGSEDILSTACYIHVQLLCES